jgi:chromosomal replication initiator protein
MHTEMCFENYVVGECNQFAYEAADAVAKNPARDYNPLVIYCKSGLGKTHLINAIAHAIPKHQKIQAHLINAEKFIDDLIFTICRDQKAAFEKMYNSFDCLLIDDIQYLSGRSHAQEYCLKTFNMLIDNGKQIVITANQFPYDIDGFGKTFKSLFVKGLIADIQSPDLETRANILKQKAMEYFFITLPDDVALYVASCVRGDIRMLEGCLVTLSAYSIATQKPIDLILAVQIMDKLNDSI